MAFLSPYHRPSSSPHTLTQSMASKNCDIYLFWCVKLFVDIRRRLSVDKLWKFHSARTAAVKSFDGLSITPERKAIFAFHISQLDKLKLFLL